jgi:CheY-like chemotaxis protein
MDSGPELEKRGPKVLLVEDDPVAAEVIRAGLEALGCSVTIATTGEDAMDLMRRDATVADWLLADIVLPGPVDGWTVGTEFRLQRPTAPVVFISAYQQRDLTRQPFRSVFLHKPVRPARLVELFRGLTAAA